MTAPGWHPDPSDPAKLRYWDGAKWTGDAVPTPPPAPAAAAKKKPIVKRVWFWLVAAFLAIVVIIIVAVAASVDDAVNNPHKVTYEVTGDGTKASNVTYTSLNGDGTSGTSQVNDAPLPFTKDIDGKGDISAYSLVAQAGDGTSITCKITVDGKVKAQQTSTGQFAVVTCSASGSG